MKRFFIFAAVFTIIVTALPYITATVSGTDKVRLPVLMYHSVKPDKCGKDSITPWELESDFKFLKENGYETVVMADLLKFAEGEADLPEKPVMLTFDDGYYNNYKYVFPLLKKYDMRIVMSVVAHATDKFTRRPSSNVEYSHITWGQLNEMIDSGCVEVQNHSYDMHTMGKRIGCGQKKNESLEDYRSALGEDIIKSQSMIYEMTGKMPCAYAYPYGKYNDNTVDILKSLGFAASFTCEFGVNLIERGGEDGFFNLKRICRAHGQSAEKLIGSTHSSTHSRLRMTRCFVPEY